MFIELNLKTSEIIQLKNDFGTFVYRFQNKVIACSLSFDLNESECLKTEISKINKETELLKLESLFPNGFFIVLIDDKQVFTFRDLSGVKTGYYKFDNVENLCISTNSHVIAKTYNNSFIDKNNIDQLLFSEFLIDGKSIYNDVYEFLPGEKRMLSKHEGKFSIVEKQKLELSNIENNLTFDENKLRLRDLIIKSHQNSIGPENIIYLSGGIDSCVMLGALDEVLPKDRIQNVSYKVKGTNEDETIFAQKAAKFLGFKCKIIEVDPFSKKTVENLEERILKYNNPYIGLLLFKPTIGENNHYFAGQDTRLHTPDINALTKRVFDKIVSYKKLNLSNKYPLLDTLLKALYKSNLTKSQNVYLRNLDHIILSALAKEKYMNSIIFKNDIKKATKFKLDISNNSFRDEHFSFDEIEISSTRQLYNLVVERKWNEQYTDDIKYMVEMGIETKNYTQMPFYNIELARFSSTIPMSIGAMFTEGVDKFSDKKVKVNKVLLREAFKDKISPDVLYRKKAVSMTIPLMFSGELGSLVKQEIKRDLESNNSLIKEFGYEGFVERYNYTNSWKVSDQQYLLRVYYLYCILIYKKNLEN